MKNRRDFLHDAGNLGLLAAVGLNPQQVQQQPQLPAAALNVREFGAKGDDRSDDTGAFKAALARMSPGKPRSLMIPPGRYRISEPIQVAEGGTVLAGETAGAVRADGSGGNGAVILPSAAFPDQRALIELGRTGSGAVQRTQVRDVMLHGENRPITGIAVLNANNPLQVDGVSIYNCGLYGVDVPGDSLDESGQLVYGTFRNMMVRNCGVGFRGRKINSSLLQSCYFVASSGVGVQLTNGNNISISNCGFEKNGGAGMILEGEGKGMFLDAVLISGCRFEGNQRRDTSAPGALVIGSHVRDALILGGRYQTANVGISVQGLGATIVAPNFIAIRQSCIAVAASAASTLIINPGMLGARDASLIDDHGKQTSVLRPGSGGVSLSAPRDNLNGKSVVGYVDAFDANGQRLGVIPIYDAV